MTEAELAIARDLYGPGKSRHAWCESLLATIAARDEEITNLEATVGKYMAQAEENRRIADLREKERDEARELSAVNKRGCDEFLKVNDDLCTITEAMRLALEGSKARCAQLEAALRELRCRSCDDQGPDDACLNDSLTCDHARRALAGPDVCR
jgi:hypothetical protein